jgi:hypothetical protein
VRAHPRTHLSDDLDLSRLRDKVFTGGLARRHPRDPAHLGCIGMLPYIPRRHTRHRAVAKGSFLETAPGAPTLPCCIAPVRT